VNLLRRHLVGAQLSTSGRVAWMYGEANASAASGTNSHCVRSIGTRRGYPRLAAVEMVWHYANWRHMPEIVANACLRPTSLPLPADLPLVWFTADQFWDWTLAEDILGSVRFGLRADDPRLAHRRKIGVIAADPEKWFATAESVPLEDLTFEVLQDASGDWAVTLTQDGPTWKTGNPAAVAQAYIADEARARAERDSGA